MGGARVLAYLAAWILIPAEGEPNSMAGVPREGLKAPSPLWSGRARRRNCCEAAEEIMTTSPGTQVSSLAKAAEHGVRLLPPARYRHPGDVIRLIIAGLVLAGALAVTVATHATYAGASAAAVAAFTPPALAGRVLAGLVQAVLVTAAAAAVVATLRHRRFRLLAGLAGAAVLAGAVVIGIIQLAGGQRPRDLAAEPASGRG